MKKNKIHQKDPLVRIVIKSLVDLPTPTSIRYLWNIGFILGITLRLQVTTGLVLSINYVAATSIAFDSVIHIIRDIERGWIIRFLHINGASLFFVCIYMHIGRGLYFNSPKKIPIVWTSGIIIFLTAIGTAFIGYVLPWGQISFWGATVITRILSALPYVGKEITIWLWGNFSVSQPTLNRFLSLHFILPLVLMRIVIVHLIILHQRGSSSPLGVETNKDKIKFLPLFIVKDVVPIVTISIIIIRIISINPNILGDVENYSIASPEVTPTHIQPEWYFLFAYAILRSIPSKLGGVLAIVISVLVILITSIKNSTLNKKFSPIKKITLMTFFCVTILLTWIGANPVEEPFSRRGKALTLVYFLTSTLIYFASLKNIALSRLRNSQRILAILRISSILGASVRIWIAAWVIIEVNTVTICFLITKEQYTNKINNLNPIKYFIVQIIGSSLILILSTSHIEKNIIEILITLRILTKIGRWPIRIWYVKLLRNILLKEISFIILITWQKVLPLILINIIAKEKETIILLITLALIRIISPIVKLKFIKEEKKILALSSINRNGWLILATIVSLPITLIFLTVYLVTVIATLRRIITNNKIKKPSRIERIKYTLNLYNFRRLPPLPIFWAKIIVILEILKEYNYKIRRYIILAIACGIVYMYLNILKEKIIKLNLKNNFNFYSEKNKERNHNIINITNFYLLATIIIIVQK